MVARVVGFLEYGKALENLDRLVSLCNEQELQAIDEIISDHDEFTVFTNLSGQMNLNPGNLNPQQAAVGTSATQSGNERRGLAWVIALARVEFGAIVEGFTRHRAPFAYIRPGTIDFTQSLELLLDGVATHYAALDKDRRFKRATGGSGGIMSTLAYSRRVRIVREMLKTAMQQGRQLYSPEQQRYLKSVSRDLDEAQVVLIASIQQYLESQITQEQQTTRHSGNFVQACQVQLDAERRELQSGKARVQGFDRRFRSNY